LDSAATDTIPPGVYTAKIQFDINEQGKIENVSIRADPGYGLGKRAMIIIANYPGQWEWTSLSYERQTKNYRIQPITFIIEEESGKEGCEDQLAGKLIS
jgi:hypothetical protein